MVKRIYRPIVGLFNKTVLYFVVGTSCPLHRILQINLKQSKIVQSVVTLLSACTNCSLVITTTRFRQCLGAGAALPHLCLLLACAMSLVLEVWCRPASRPSSTDCLGSRTYPKSFLYELVSLRMTSTGTYLRSIRRIAAILALVQCHITGPSPLATILCCSESGFPHRTHELVSVCPIAVILSFVGRMSCIV